MKFAGKDLKTPGAFSMITGGDGKTYGKLDFSKYMEQFISDRFVDFEIITEEVTGLKIPKSAVTDVEFYLTLKNSCRRRQGLFKGNVYGKRGWSRSCVLRYL